MGTNSKIAIIRIAGKTGIDMKTKETLERLNLKRKYSCAVIENPDSAQFGMIKKAGDFAAFGEIDDETYKKLKEARGKKGGSFFRLHPPRRGIDSKKHFGETKKGVLGNNGEKINELIARML